MGTPHYDVAGGADDAALNAVSQAVYTGVYPKVFKGTIHVGQDNIQSFDYDIKSAPVFTLEPSAQLSELHRARLKSAVKPNKLTASVEEASQATFDTLFSSVDLKLVYEDNTNTAVSGSLEASGQVRVNADSTLSLQLLKGTMTIPGEDALSQILNKVCIPMLIDYLNREIFSPIIIPPLKFYDVTLTLPVILVQNKTLLSFSVLSSPASPSHVTPPPPGNWPSGKVFLGPDVPLLNATADGYLKEESITGTWKYNISIPLVCNLGLTANYRIEMGNVRFQLGSQNSVTGSMDATAAAGFSGDCGIFKPSFSASAAASPKLTASISALGSQVYLTILNVDDINFKIEFSGVPDYVNDVLSEIASAFGDVLAAALNVLKGLTIPVFTIPAINFAIAGISFSVELTQLQLSNTSAPGGVRLAMVTGLARVSSSGAALSRQVKGAR